MSAKAESVKACFSSIASHYDRMNTLLSLSMHKGWNRELIQTVHGAKHLLDLCSGTGEIALGFLKENPESRATLLDFCPKMLDLAQKKGLPFQERFDIIEADAQLLPFADESFDAITIAYGIRNVEHPIRCFEESNRVLQKGGSLSILELTRPKGLAGIGHRAYLQLLPVAGRLIAQSAPAYRYLATSIQSFVSPKRLTEELSQAGFVDISCRPLFMGTATLMTASKGESAPTC